MLMLRILVEPNSQYPIIDEIKNLLFQSFDFINTVNLDNAINSCKHGINECIEMKKIAVTLLDEITANRCYVVQEYFNLLMAFSSFWQLIQSSKYSDSWSKLQNAIDYLNSIQRFTDAKDIFYLNLFKRHLKQLEKLYPYQFFQSVEMVIQEQHCSICKRNSLNPACTHIPGHLYYGEMAVTVVTKADLIAVSLVEHPADKRCVVIYEDNSDAFKVIRTFTSRVKFPMQLFDLEDTVRKIDVSELDNVGRNDTCPCGSGKKYKKCCLSKGFIEKPHVEILLKQVTVLKPFIN